MIFFDVMGTDKRHPSDGQIWRIHLSVRYVGLSKDPSDTRRSSVYEYRGELDVKGTIRRKLMHLTTISSTRRESVKVH